MRLTDGNILPLCLLENILNKEYVLLDKVLPDINVNLKQFYIKNLWHRFVPASLDSLVH